MELQVPKDRMLAAEAKKAFPRAGSVIGRMARQSDGGKPGRTASQHMQLAQDADPLAP